MASDFQLIINSFTIGYAVYKYPQLPPQCPIPIFRQLKYIQESCDEDPKEDTISLRYHEIVCEIASQHLKPLLHYQLNVDPSVHDQSSPQYYFSAALDLLLWFCMNQSACEIIALFPGFLASIIDKVINPRFAQFMSSCIRPVDARGQNRAFEIEFCKLIGLIQWLTMYNNYQTAHEHGNQLPRVLRKWMDTYHGTDIALRAKQLVDLLQSNSTANSKNRKIHHCISSKWKCGWEECALTDGLVVACEQCHMQRYCNDEHYWSDWYHHQKICNKGFIENPQ